MPRSKTVTHLSLSEGGLIITGMTTQVSYFRSKEGILALFLSIACLVYFLVVPEDETSVRRAQAKAENKSITLQTEKGVFKDNHKEEIVASSESDSIEAPFCLNLPILMYHHVEPLDIAKREGHAQLTVNPNMFEKHIQELHEKGYKIIPISEAVQALISNTNPGKVAVITLDDGYKDNFEYALPIAQKYQAPITFFISTGLLENPGYMTWSDLKSAQNSNLVTILNHTWSHFSLPAGNVSESREEVKTAENALIEHLGTIHKFFAYPYGSFDDKSLEIMKSEEYIAAFTTQVSTQLCDDQMLALPRVRIGEAPLSYFGL